MTLANPLGPVVRGLEQVAATDQAASQFRDGQYLGVEDVSKYVTPELAYIVRVERSKAKVGGEETPTNISLRVTMIMRPEDGVWKIVHRHADPITTTQPAESIIQQITLSMYRQLDETILERFETVGRLRDDKSGPKNAGEGLLQLIKQLPPGGPSHPTSRQVCRHHSA